MGINIKSSQAISLDTNIFIRSLDDPTQSGDEARDLIVHIQKIAPRVFISAILLEEFFVRVYKDKREKEEINILNFY